MSDECILKIRLYLLSEKNDKKFRKMYAQYFNIYPDSKMVESYKTSFIKFIENEFNSGNFTDIFLNYVNIYSVDLFTFILFDKLGNLVNYKLNKNDIKEIALIKGVESFVKNDTISENNSNILNLVKKEIFSVQKEKEKVESKIKDEILLSNYRIYMNEVNKYDLLTKDEERMLIEDYQKNDNKESLNKLIIHNQRLVVRIAFHMISKAYHKKVDVDIMDFIQEGNFGLIRSIEKFNLEENTKLSTYAYRNIQHKIQRYIENNGRTVRIPVNKNEQIDKIYNMESSYIQELGRQLTDTEKEELIYSKVAYDKDEPLYFKLSLDEKINISDSKGKSDGYYLIDTIADKMVKPTDAESDSKADREAIDQVLNTYIEKSKNKNIATRNALIFRLRYGLFNDECYNIINLHNLKTRKTKDGVEIVNHEEIAKALPIKRARIQQIEAKVLEYVTKALISYEYELTGVKYQYDVNTKKALRIR